MKVLDLKEGDILIRLSDESEWEFQKYILAKITISANEPSNQSRSGTAEYIVVTKPLKPRKNRPGDLEFREMHANEFRFGRSK